MFDDGVMVVLHYNSDVWYYDGVMVVLRYNSDVWCYDSVMVYYVISVFR